MAKESAARQEPIRRGKKSKFPRIPQIVEGKQMRVSKRKAANENANPVLRMLNVWKKDAEIRNGYPQVVTGIEANRIANQFALIAANNQFKNVGEGARFLVEEGLDLDSEAVRSVVKNRVLVLAAEKKKKFKNLLMGTTSLTPFNSQE